jgi:probable HAF family extracellular repeat protein
VNNAGQIVGTIRYAGGAPIAQPNPSFLVSGGTASNLGTLGGLNASAYAINNNGIVVGDSTLADGSQHAFIYRNGRITDLNSLIATSGWVLTSARAINDRGQIAGVGTLNGINSGFLLTPIDSGAVQPPSIATQPAGGTFELGASITLTASVTGTPPFGFEWQKDGKPLTGPFTNSLVLNSLKGTDSGIYRLVVTNSAGRATSVEAALQVLDPVLATALYTVVQVRGEVGGRYQIEYKNQPEATAWLPLSSLTLTQNPQLVLQPTSVNMESHFFKSLVSNHPKFCYMKVFWNG